MHTIIKFINNGVLVGCSGNSGPPTQITPSPKSISINLNNQLTYNVNQLFNKEPGTIASFFIKTHPTNGSISLSGYILVYTPNLNYEGTDSLEIQANEPRKSGAPISKLTIIITNQSEG